MPEIVRIKVEVDQRSNAAISQIVGLKKTIDDINATHINVQVDNANQLEQVTRKMTAYNNSVARRVTAENQLRVEELRTQAALFKRETAEERTKQAIERTRQAEERTAQATERTRQAEERTAQTRERTVQITERQSAANTRLGGSVTGLVTRFVSLHMLLSRTVSAFRDALQTMKDVDSALVTIQKTTGFTGQQLDRLTNSAYELANAYGRTATEILNAASVYARAGFKDNLDQMTELSALLQNVGDLEGEVAAKFLIATNAAWKLNGSYDALMGVIDGLNAQTNQAAVDMEALTSGITVAGSVFSNAGESVQTFSGLLGAGVAVTQRSGSEVARGLRTIAMNIRQIKGELDDGEIIDEASISDAAKALHSVGISVADSNGELRLTSEVLDELAGRWDSLTSAEQSYIAQSLAGKRQANILVSLMQNWEEAQRQMTLYANGAGSAMRENEIYLNSWEAKTKQLSSAWTKFVNDLVDTDLIKGALDALIKIVDFLDSKLGRLLVTSGGVGIAVLGVTGAFTKLTAAMKALSGVVAANPLFLIASGLAAATTAIGYMVESVVDATENWTNAAQEAQSTYEGITKQVEELEARESQLTELENARLGILRQQADEAQKVAKEAARSAYYSEYLSGIGTLPMGGQIRPTQQTTEAGAQYTGGAFGLAKILGATVVGTGGKTSEDQSLKNAQQLLTRYHEILSAMKTAKGEVYSSLEKESQTVLSEITQMAAHLLDLAEILGDELPEAGQNALLLLETFLTGLNKTSQKTSEVVIGNKRLRDSLQELSDKADAIDTVLQAVADALGQYGEGSVQAYNAMQNLESVIPGSTDKLYDFETATLKSADALDGSKSSLLDLIDAEKQVNFQNAIDQMNAVAQAAWDMWAAEAAAVQGLSQDDLLRAGEWMNNSSVDAIIAEREKWNAYVSTLRGRSDYAGSSGGGGRSSSSSDPELARLQNIVKLRKQEVEFLKASGKTQEEINAKQKEVQSALHDLAEYMRKIEADEADILSLSTEWWTIQNSMADVEEDQLKVYQDRVSLLKSQLSLLEAQGADTDTIEAKQREIQDALKAQMDYMESIGASQAEINALATEWYNIENNILDTHKKLFDELKKTIDEYYDAAVTDKEKELQLEEKILEVQKAQAALANAQKERTVRYFNAASGQWEWGANQKNVQAAKEALQKAQESLNDYQKEQAWKEFKDAWEYVAEQIKAGAITFDQAYQYMERKMKELQNKYNVDMSGVLKDSVGQFKGVNKTIKEFNGQTAKELGNAVGELKKQNEQLKAQTGVLNTSTENAKSAVEAFKQAFDNVAEAVKNGDMTFDEAYQTLKDAAVEISDKYGVDMTQALDMAIKQMDEIYSGLDGISKAVQEGALTPAEAFDIISKALNAVSEKYGKNITDEVNAILEKKGGFKDGLAGLAKAVENGEISIEDAFGYIQDATQEVSEKYGIDMKGELDTAIQAMGKSSDALDDLWKAIVMNKMRMNSVSWLELDEQKKKAQEAGDTATVERITKEQEALHAENEALGKTIGATYDKSGYWSLNGRRLYDPQADKASGAFSSGGGGVSPATTGSSKAGGNQDLLDIKWKSSAESHLIPGLGYVNTGEATADLFNLKAGQTGNVARALLMMYGTPEEQTAYFNGGGIPASLAERLQNQPQDFYYSIPATRAGISDVFTGSTNAKGQYSGGAIVYKGGAGDSVVQVQNGKVMATGLQDMGSDIILTPDGRAYRMDSKGNLIDNGETWSNGLGDLATQLVLLTAMFKDQLAMADSGNFSNAQIYGSQITYDEGGVLHGLGGIKATDRDEMVLPPDITERLLNPINNGLIRERMDYLRLMTGIPTKFAGNSVSKVGTQYNGDVSSYTMNGVTISEDKARSTTVYELAQMARSLGSYQRS